MSPNPTDLEKRGSRVIQEWAGEIPTKGVPDLPE